MSICRKTDVPMNQQNAPKKSCPEKEWICKKQDKLLNRNIGYSMRGYLDAPVGVLRSRKKAGTQFDYGITFENEGGEDGMGEAGSEGRLLGCGGDCCALACSRCSKVFLSEQGFRYHATTVHAAAREQPQPAVVLVKQKSHQKAPKEYRCIPCNKHYKNHNGLKYHRQKHHAGELQEKKNGTK